MGAKVQPSSYAVPAIVTAPLSASRTLVDPVRYAWEWRNQGIASVSARNGTLTMSSPLETADNWHFLAKNVPAKPYSIIIHYVAVLVNVNFMGVCVGWLQSSNNNFAIADQRVGTSSSSHGTPWANTANYLNTNPLFVYQWVKLTDDVTNRRIYYGPDGKVWGLFHSIATNTDVTPDRLVFGLEARNATYPVSLVLDSWEELAGS
jgi:hypothetical protein